MNLNWEKVLSHIVEKKELSTDEQLSIVLEKDEIKNLLEFMAENGEYINQVFSSEKSDLSENSKRMFAKLIIRFINNHDDFFVIYKNTDIIRNIFIYENKLNNVVKYISKLVLNNNTNEKASLFSFAYFLHHYKIDDILIEDFIKENIDHDANGLIEFKNINSVMVANYFLQKMENIVKTEKGLNQLQKLLMSKNIDVLEFCTLLKKSNILSNESFYKFLEEILNNIKFENLNKNNTELYQYAKNLYSDISKEDLFELFMNETKAVNSIYESSNNKKYNDLITLRFVMDDKLYAKTKIKKLEELIQEKKFRSNTRISFKMIEEKLENLKIKLINDKDNNIITEKDVLSDNFLFILKNTKQYKENSINFNSNNSNSNLYKKVYDIIKNELYEKEVLSKKTLMFLVKNIPLDDIEYILREVILGMSLFSHMEKEQIYSENYDKILYIYDQNDNQPIEELITYVEEFKASKSEELLIKKLESQLVTLKKELSQLKNKNSVVEEYFDKKNIFHAVKKVFDKNDIVDIVNNKINKSIGDEKLEYQSLELIKIVDSVWKINSSNFSSFFMKMIDRSLENGKELNFESSWLKDAFFNKLKLLPTYNLSRVSEEYDRYSEDKQQQKQIDIYQNMLRCSEYHNQMEFEDIINQSNEMSLYMKKEMKEVEKKHANALRKVNEFDDQKAIDDIFLLLNSLSEKVTIKYNDEKAFIFAMKKYFEYHGELPKTTEVQVNDVNNFWLLKVLEQLPANSIDKVNELTNFMSNRVKLIEDKSIRHWASILNVTELDITKGLIKNTNDNNFLSSLDEKIIRSLSLNSKMMWDDKDFVLKITEMIENLNIKKKNLLLEKIPMEIAKVYKYFDENNVENWKATLREAFMHQMLSEKTEVKTKKKI